FWPKVSENKGAAPHVPSNLPAGLDRDRRPSPRKRPGAPPGYFPSRCEARIHRMKHGLPKKDSCNKNRFFSQYLLILPSEIPFCLGLRPVNEEGNGGGHAKAAQHSEADQDQVEDPDPLFGGKEKRGNKSAGEHQRAQDQYATHG